MEINIKHFFQVPFEALRERNFHMLIFGYNVETRQVIFFNSPGYVLMIVCVWLAFAEWTSRVIPCLLWMLMTPKCKHPAVTPGSAMFFLLETPVSIWNQFFLKYHLSSRGRIIQGETRNYDDARACLRLVESGGFVFGIDGTHANVNAKRWKPWVIGDGGRVCLTTTNIKRFSSKRIETVLWNMTPPSRNIFSYGSSIIFRIPAIYKMF